MFSTVMVAVSLYILYICNMSLVFALSYFAHICFAILHLVTDIHLFWAICWNCGLSSLLIVPSEHGIISASDLSREAPDLTNSFAFSLPKMFSWSGTQIRDKWSWHYSELKAFLHLLAICLCKWSLSISSRI